MKHGVFHASDTSRNSRLISVLDEHFKCGHHVDTLKLGLVKLLQQHAVEYMSIFRQMEIQNSDSVLELVPADFKALYAYKRNDYVSCFLLSFSLYNSRVALVNRQKLTHFMPILAYPEFIQLMDDDITSLCALTLIVEPSCRDGNFPQHNGILQHTFLLYLMSQCVMKLGRPVALIDKYLPNINDLHKGYAQCSTLDQLMLKLLEWKLQKLRSPCIQSDAHTNEEQRHRAKSGNTNRSKLRCKTFKMPTFPTFKFNP